MSQLGPIAGGLFFAGGAVAAKVFAESEWAKTVAEMAMHLASDKASELFNSAAEGFRSGRNGDIEKSMKEAALEALTHLRAHAPADSGPWFTVWLHHLTLSQPAEIFAGARHLDPAALTCDDHQFRALWWTHMEPVLAGWYASQTSNKTLNLNPDPLPSALSDYLRERFPEALQEAHLVVLRRAELLPSWIAFQQHIYRDTLNRLEAIKAQLDRIEGKLDRALAGHSSGDQTPVWTIPAVTHTFQDRPDLIDQIDDSLHKSATALTALSGLGGIGKTQLARRFATLHRPRYTLGVWLNAESEGDILTSLSALAPLLGVPVEQDQSATVALVLNAISARLTACLLYTSPSPRD